MPLQGHTAAAGIGGDGEAVRPVEVPPAEDKAGGEEEEGGEVSGGTAGAASTSSPAERATKKKNLYSKDIADMVGSSSLCISLIVPFLYPLIMFLSNEKSSY